MLDLVRNPGDRFSQDAAQIVQTLACPETEAITLSKQQTITALLHRQSVHSFTYAKSFSHGAAPNLLYC